MYKKTMHRKMSILVALVFAGAIFWSESTSAETHSPMVWIAPNDPTHGGAIDFWDMLKPDAPWQKAKSRVQVFEIAQNLVTNGPPDKLRELYSYLKQNHIALAVSIGMLTWSDQCGKHVEGYVPPGGSEYVAKRIQWLGGELAYIDVDEALEFGRYYDGKGACHSTMDAVAQDVAANFKAYQGAFPNVQLGDTEPVGPHADEPNSNEWLKFMQAWLDILQSKTGAHLAFFHEDVNWKIPVELYVPRLSNLMQSNHIPFGVSLIASDGAGPDAKWMKGAEANIEAIKKLKMPPLDHAWFTTWYGPPSHNLPETSSEAFTYLINFYFDRN